MQIILLSGGSGKRLWPLSNDSRSKQFLKLLPAANGGRESMVQRVLRQINESGLACPVTIATSASQKDAIINQLGEEVNVVTEPCRRDTFPAICLATAYLEMEAKCPMDETVVVMPCDPYTEDRYFHTIAQMARAVEAHAADLVLMGVKPTYPSAKYGYVIPGDETDGIYRVERFTEKPDVPTAERFIAQGAFWNGGVFAFRLGYLVDIVRRYMSYGSFAELRNRYEELPKISFDYEVAEKAQSVAVIPYDGEWKDLGTWNTLTDELRDHGVGNVVIDDKTENTHVVNELEIPVMCLGVKNLVIAASCDGILVSEKSQSENIKHYADRLLRMPMYEERRWGEFKVVSSSEFADGSQSFTKQLRIQAGKEIKNSVQADFDKVWTVVDGEGELEMNGITTAMHRGVTVAIARGTAHSLCATSALTIVEVEIGGKR
ncbi:MAG: mannose-1-phosphate guanylyltransferase [Bacteroidales bacterium]|nr:mannose-1-phosphate guanylyltransferase [Bacteroidales bacterium]